MVFRKASFLIITFADKNTNAYSKFTKEINEKYADQNGYEFRTFDKNELDSSFDVHYMKPYLLHKLIKENSAFKYNWIVWMDADLAVNKPDIKLESFIKPGYEIIICHDGVNKCDKLGSKAKSKHFVNTGMFFIKNSNWSKNFCKKWLDEAGKYKKGSFNQDQDKFVSMLQNNEMKSMDKTFVFPATAFNSIFGCPTADTFVWHLMKKPQDERIREFKTILGRKEKVKLKKRQFNTGVPHDGGLTDQEIEHLLNQSVNGRFRGRLFQDGVKIGDSAPITIVMMYDEPIHSYALYTDSINRLYCRRHGYDLVVIPKTLSNRDPQWDKVLAVLKVMEKVQSKHVMWIDADACFQDHSQKIEDAIIAKSPGKSFYICDDTPHKGKSAVSNEIYVNTGTFLVANDEWGKGFMRKWWETPMGKENLLYHEQDVLNTFFMRNDFNLKEEGVVMDANAFNSYNINDSSEFVKHMMAQSTGERIRVFKSLFNKVRSDFEKEVQPLYLVEMPAYFHVTKKELLAREETSKSAKSLRLALISLGATLLLVALLIIYERRSRAKV